ncbi:hypothetical protein C0081_15380 [Cohaesibacter celericrescens]|uniref:diguanylate cyclase n=2 Tax=Cohaesibacter celericrescens TaxID=2067669 RepID=A0A2N5XPC1_9HYPH|nr:hypothetical protein C0081_15380 [Cohaesibacter celericrescens]
MLTALDTATIFACFMLAMVASAVTMTVVWFNNPKSHSAGYWTFTYLTGIAAGAILVLWQQLGSYVVILSTLSIYACHWFLWAGFRSFNNQTAPISVLVVAVFVYLAAVTYNPSLYLDLNLSTAMHSLFIGAASLVSAYTVFTGPESKSLPITLSATIILVSHGLFRFSFLYFTLFDPSPIVDGRMAAPWWKISLLEIFFNTMLMAISTVILIKDRSEKLHRVASETDVLTGIANRRAFVEKTKNAAIGSDTGAALAVLDLDHFKKINDKYGHAAGDTALIDFVNIVTKCLPRKALFGRMGGEEFAVYLPSGSGEPLDILEKVCKQVAESNIQHNSTHIPLTLSIGIATIEAVGNNFDTLFASADRALYLAKQEGRNRVKLFSHTERLREMFNQQNNLAEQQTRSIQAS